MFQFKQGAVLDAICEALPSLSGSALIKLHARDSQRDTDQQRGPCDVTMFTWQENTSNGLQPTSDGLQPTVLAMASNRLAMVSNGL